MGTGCGGDRGGKGFSLDERPEFGTVLSMTKEHFEILVSQIEDILDKLAICAVTSKLGKSFEKVARELGISC